MKEIWKKVAFVSLAMAVAFGVSVGLRERDETDAGREIENEEMLDDKAGEVAKEERVAREGKLLEGWTEQPCIVIDPGHGGFDPGKIGINNAPEKDVNLAIAKLLRDNLEASGVKVVMTRVEDVALGGTGEENAKVRDLKRRIEVIEEAAPRAAVSIHQNSYPEEYVHGAQVFYYVTSKEGKRLAEALQNRLVREIDPENERQVKDNNSYFLLKKTAVPLVIAECGFLSNREEAEKLCDPHYQEDVAWALYLGIMDYLQENK